MKIATKAMANNNSVTVKITFPTEEHYDFFKFLIESEVLEHKLDGKPMTDKIDLYQHMLQQLWEQDENKS